MKKAAFYIFLLLVQLGFSQDTAIINRMRKATLQILVYDSNGRAFGAGTGFFISTKGELRVMTCFHVVTYEINDKTKKNYNFLVLPRIRGITWRGDTIDLGIVVQHDISSLKIDAVYDFAVLAPNEPNKIVNSVKILPLSSRPPYMGEHIYFTGFPFGTILISEYGMLVGEEWNYLYFNPSCLAGDSGGPLVDERGYVIGIVDFRIAGKPDTHNDPPYVKKLMAEIEAIGNIGIGGAVKMSSIFKALDAKR